MRGAQAQKLGLQRLRLRAGGFRVDVDPDRLAGQGLHAHAQGLKVGVGLVGVRADSDLRQRPERGLQLGLQRPGEGAAGLLALAGGLLAGPGAADADGVGDGAADRGDEGGGDVAAEGGADPRAATDTGGHGLRERLPGQAPGLLPGTRGRLGKRGPQTLADSPGIGDDLDLDGADDDCHGGPPYVRE
ncbi:hypothetical protein [Streptomyces sp. NPDC053048]|uniref:hypothetical protein n=1 Tax=Streptomyces sp. NPDC053048 TaxID=3365694 RepID=UPI0037D69DCF